VEGRRSSLILAAEGSWQSKKGIVQHLQATRFGPTIWIQCLFVVEAENCN
jgi:hypothetical protein